MKTRHIVAILAISGTLLMGFILTRHTGQSGFDETNQTDQTMLQDEEIIGNYGEKITTEGAVQASQVLAKLGDQESVDLKVEGTIVEVCQMKGCWMTMDVGSGQTMRITFKDYGFFVPKASSGYKAVIEGTVSKQLVDVETLKHYAEDEGKTGEEVAAITEPQEKLNFEAVGVVITELAK